MDKSTDPTPFEAARRRVQDTPELAAHADFILADWREGEDHWQWVATAPVAEIVDWVVGSR